mgnify:CR=1 FL=1
MKVGVIMGSVSDYEVMADAVATLDQITSSKTAGNRTLVFTLTDGEAGNSMKFTIPKIKYTGGQPDVGDEGPITLSMPFQALLDSAAGGALKIERIAHA